MPRNFPTWNKRLWAIRFDFENQSNFPAKFFTTMVETMVTVKQKYLTEPTTNRSAQAVAWNARKGEEKRRNVSPPVFGGLLCSSTMHRKAIGTKRSETALKTLASEKQYTDIPER